MADGTISARDAAKQIISIALDELGNFATIAVAKATIGSLTTADSIATFGISGVLRAAALTTLIRGAVGAAKGIINKNLWTGGYSGAGGKYEPKGVVHGGEWVANAEMVASPQTGPIIQALENMRSNGRGYSEGGMVVSGSGSPGTGAGSAGSLFSSDPELKKLLRMNALFLARLDQNGVNMKFGYVEADNVRKGMDKLDEIEGSVTL
jgi:hypothetical protein